MLCTEVWLYGYDLYLVSMLVIQKSLKSAEWLWFCNDSIEKFHLQWVRKTKQSNLLQSLHDHSVSSAVLHRKHWLGRDIMKNQQQQKELSNSAYSHTTKLSNQPKHLNKNTLCPPTVCKLVYFHSNSLSTRHYRGLFWKQSDIIR